MDPRADPRNCSVSEAARWIGVARQTLTAWCQALGIDHTKGVSVPEIVKSKLEEAREAGAAAERKRFGGVAAAIDEAEAEGWISEEEAKRRRLVAQMIQEEIRADEARHRVVPIADVAPVFAELLVPVREALMGLGPRVSPAIAVETGGDAAVISSLIRKHTDETLEELQRAEGRARMGPADDAA